MDTVDVSAPEAIEVQLTATNEQCFENNDGAITAIASGGSGGYVYTWSDGTIGDNPSPSGLAPMEYTVTVTDINSCTAEASIIIEPATIMVLSSTPSHVVCGGDSNGAIDLQVSGGVEPYTYQWDNSETTEDISDLSGGTYVVEVIDANNCTQSTTITVDEPTTIEVTFTVENVLCFQGTNGAVAINASGGEGTLSFDWQGPDSFTSNDEDLQDVMAGDYTLVVSDDNGCSTSLMVNIIEPATGMTGAVEPIDMICFGGDNGTATVVPNGGTEPYIYEWSNGATTATVNNLVAGTYSVTVTDAGDCSFTDEAIVESLPELSANLAQTASSCHSGNDGSATISSIQYGNTTADPADFTFEWSTTPIQNNITANNLTGGETYRVTMTDNLGCQAVQTISIEHPTAVELSTNNIQDVNCYEGSDGQITVSASGGTAPYTYQWDIAAAQQTGETAENLAAGFYFVTATDANNCDATISVTVEEPRQLNADLTTFDVSCYGEATGKISSEVNGGTAPYTYQWSNGLTTPNITHLKSDNFQLTITDNNGCTMEANAFVEQPAEPLSGIISKEDITCNGGQDGVILVQGSGGTPGYTYSLDNSNYTTSSYMTNLPSDAYRVYIKDDRGCIYLTESILLEDPEPIEVELGDDIIIKYGDSIILVPDVTGEFGEPMFEWTPKDTTLINCLDCENPQVAPPYQVSYKVIVVDENGCETEDIVTVYVTKERKVFVPTGFTPNGDNVNDLLLIHGPPETKVLSFRIFDRWGEMVFEDFGYQVNNRTRGWNGQFRNKEMGTGSYIWYLEVEYSDGEREVLKGSTSLIR
jgi:gliding motility-associated-like protein